MEYREFVKSTILDLSDQGFLQIKNTIVGEYLTFSVIDESSLTKEILGEKICDYFEKLELKTGVSFDHHVIAFVNNINAIVKGKIAEAPQNKKGNTSPVPVPRARKYYEKALLIRNSRTLTIKQLLEYCRIIMCLYMAIINNHFKTIDNLDFSASSLNLEMIINAMKKEQKNAPLQMRKEKRFKISDLYCSDTCTFIMAMLLLNKIEDAQVKGDF